MSEKLLEALKEITGSGMFSNIMHILDMQEVLWNAIDELMSVYPEKADVLWYSFKAIGETEIFFREYRLEIWKSHVYELLHRLGEGKANKDQLQYGTAAEVMLAIYQVTMQTPITQTYCALYERMFRTVFADQELIHDQLSKTWITAAEWLEREHEAIGYIPHESWTGELDIEETEARRKIRNIRKIKYPDKTEIEKLKADDFKHGNRMPWLQYQTEPFQMTMLVEVENG